MDEFSIGHLKNKLSPTLSGGERRRLEIARALASNPKFILLDEPLAGIDPIAIRDIKELVSHLKERNIGEEKIRLLLEKGQNLISENPPQ